MMRLSTDDSFKLLRKMEDVTVTADAVKCPAKLGRPFGSRDSCKRKTPDRSHLCKASDDIDARNAEYESDTSRCQVVFEALAVLKMVMVRSRVSRDVPPELVIMAEQVLTMAGEWMPEVLSGAAAPGAPS